MTDREQELLAALKAVAMSTNTICLTGDHGRCDCGGDLVRAAIASADASASRAVSPDQQAVIAEAERLLKDITPGPWAWEWIAEKSNEWAVGQAFDAQGQPIEGRIPEGEWIEDTVIERRLIGMNESGHAWAADAEFIAAAPRIVRKLLAALSPQEPR